jgi:hypothetical protein
MAKEKQVFEKVAEYWGLFAILAIALILFLIPAKNGLPDEEYQGCEREDSICITTKVKALNDKSDGSRIVTVEVPDDPRTYDKKIDVDFKINDSNDAISIGNTVVMDFNQGKNRASVWIEYDTRLIWKLATLAVWHGPTAIIDLETFEEIAPED